MSTSDNIFVRFWPVTVESHSDIVSKNLEFRIAEIYLKSGMRVPGFLMQGVLNTYFEGAYLFDRLASRFTDHETPPTEEIAERSGPLMEAHYDLPSVLFSNFLGETMKYSTGLWLDGVETLDEAQTTMMVDLCVKAKLEDGHKILDLGCGFGSLCRFLLERFPNTQVCGVTMSKTQVEYIRSRAREPEHPFSSDRFQLIRGDFNEVNFEEKYDRILSLGVFEHITNISTALCKINKCLKEDGRCFLHYIVYRLPTKAIAPARQNSFLSRYIFPGMRIWPYNEIWRHSRNMVVEQEWFLNGIHYDRTLQEWLHNFHHNGDRISRAFDCEDRVLKLWDFYFRSCIATFRAGSGRYIAEAEGLIIEPAATLDWFDSSTPNRLIPTVIRAAEIESDRKKPDRTRIGRRYGDHQRPWGYRTC